jgi:urease accessory protein
MFKIQFPSSDDTSQQPPSKQYRLMVAIAALVVISLLTLSGGSPIEHTVSNGWEGFIWGLADPVIGLDKLAGIVAVGLLSARFVRGVWISLAFVVAAFAGQMIHLFPINILGTEIAISTVSAAIAISTIIFGVILVLPIHPGWMALSLLSVGAGLSQGYADSQTIINADLVTMITYLVGVTLTQTVLIMSAREISKIITKQAINQMFPRTIRWVGLTFCAIGVVFLSNAVI